MVRARHRWHPPPDASRAIGPFNAEWRLTAHWVHLPSALVVPELPPSIKRYSITFADNIVEISCQILCPLLTGNLKNDGRIMIEKVHDN